MSHFAFFGAVFGVFTYEKRRGRESNPRIEFLPMQNQKSHNFAQYPVTQSPPTFSVIRVYDAAGNVIETHEHKGDFKES
jgi:hypothetical protein